MFLLETTHSEQSPKFDQFGEISNKAHKADGVSFTHKCRVILQAGSQVWGSVINPGPCKRLRRPFTVLMFFSSTKTSAPPIQSAGSVIVSPCLSASVCSEL